MARTMKKFSAGGAQGRYDRRMADIEKDYKKAMTRKTGKDAEVAEAKRQQRIADAKDDLAKRTGADRTATRAAERAAEDTLRSTRRQGKSLLGVESFMKSPEFSTKSASEKAPASAATATPEAVKDKPKSFGAAFKEARARLGSGKTFTYNGKSFTTNIAGESRKAPAAAAKTPPAAAAKTPPAAAAKTPPAAAAKTPPAAAKAAGPKPVDSIANRVAAMFTSEAMAKRNADYAKSQKAKGYAKGGKAKTMKKFAKGGSIPPQPTAAERAADAKFRTSVKKIKVTPKEGKVIESANRSEGRRYAAGGVTKEMPSSKAMGSLNMAKGGKAKMKPAAKAKGKPFAATKFGAAMMKKGADAKGRAMPKFAKGGSIDGCAVKGKTKTSMVKMARGGKTC